MLWQRLRSDRVMAGDDYVVVEGVNEREAFGCTSAHGFYTGFVIVRAVQNYVRAVAPCRGDFDERRRQRHANQGADSQFPGMVGNALRMIAGRGGDYSAPTFLRI